MVVPSLLDPRCKIKQLERKLGLVCSFSFSKRMTVDVTYLCICMFVEEKKKNSHPTSLVYLSIHSEQLYMHNGCEVRVKKERLTLVP